MDASVGAAAADALESLFSQSHAMARHDSDDDQLEMDLGEAARQAPSSAPSSPGPWVVCRYSKTRVAKAGRALVDGTESDVDLDVINNWRSSHSFPLNTFQVTLRRKASQVDVNAAHDSSHPHPTRRAKQIGWRAQAVK